MIGPIKLNVEKEDQRHVDALVYAQAAASSSLRPFRDTFGFLMVT